MDRMDKLIAAAVRQSFRVWQDKSGGWYFQKGIVTMRFKRTPEKGGEWIAMIGALKGAGLVFPDTGR